MNNNQVPDEKTTDKKLIDKKIIVIPIGDPAGIGPEIAFKALCKKEIYDYCKPILVGDIEPLEKIRDILSRLNESRPEENHYIPFKEAKIHLINDPAKGRYEPGFINVVSPGCDGVGGIAFGKVQAAAGRASYEYIVKAASLAMDRKAAAMATTSINKEAIRAAGIDFIGHTEMLADLGGVEDPLTMFQVRDMRVFFLSRHVSLRKACDMVTQKRLADYIARCSEALQMLGVERSLIAVAGLNPHNGEHGLFGDEEGREVEPAVLAAREAGHNVVGPIPADSVFHQCLWGRFDAVLSLYHDQGHIAIKTLDFERTISLTIGLPFLRTSVDHGTAFDIAGKGIASSVSMEEAIRLAAYYAPVYSTK